MTSRQARFTTACQQILALAAVLAFVVPAANVVSLDVVGGSSGPVAAGAATVDANGPALDPDQKAQVAGAPVDAAVTEYDLTAGAPEPAAALPGVDARTAAPQADAAPQQPAAASTETLPDGRTELAAAPQTVATFGTVGVTWDEGQAVTEDAIDIQVRTSTDGEWSDWSDLEFHDEHGPDAGTPEAAGVRPGTDPMVVGAVDQVQVRTISETAPPAGLRLAVMEPQDGAAAPTTEQAPAIDTADLAAAAPAPQEVPADGAPAMELSAKSYAAPQPVIYSRAQWGANEKIRDKTSLRYGKINAGFVHHTVNGNNYSEAEVPGILRSIYSYHVKSRGWSDIGYNFLVDRFGRIWEGRYGGVDKAVVGAHTAGYNQYSFAMSAIGNYDIAAPSQALVDAYGALFAWKLGMNGVSASSTAQKLGSKTFKAINGHRDAGSTACPGRYLYAKLSEIRTRAGSLQGGYVPPTTTPAPPVDPSAIATQDGPWTGSALRSSLTSSGYPDLILRRAADGRGVVLPTGGLTNFAAPRTLSGKGWSKRRNVSVSKDLTGDGVSDLVFSTKSGNFYIRPGNGRGGFGKAIRVKALSKYAKFLPVGDVTGDGRNDLVAVSRSNKRMVVLARTPRNRFKRYHLPAGFTKYKKVFSAGDVTSDGVGDLLAVDRKGRLVLRAGAGRGRFAAAKVVPGSWAAYRSFTGGVDLTGDGRHDLVAKDASGRLSVFPSRGNGTFGEAYGPTVTAVPRLVGASVAGNLVGGAGADLVGRVGDSLVVVPNADTYELGAPIDTGRSLKSAVSLVNVGDWNGDGHGDVVTVAKNGNLHLWAGVGGGKLAAHKVIGSGWSGFSQVQATGDVTGDGKPDLLAIEPNGTSWVYTGAGAAGLTGNRVPAGSSMIMKLPVSTAGYDWVLGVSSLTGAAHADAVVRESGTGRLFVLDAASGFTGRRLLGDGMTAYDLAD